MNEFLITFRESLESALIVGLVYTRLVKLDWKAGQRGLWLGLFSALVVSVLFAVVLNALQASLPESAEPFVEGVLMLTASGFLLYMVIWMAGNASMRNRIVAQTSTQTGVWAVFLLVFFGVVREGLETALFLSATVQQNDGQLSIIGAALGILLAIAIGWLIFIRGRRLPMKQFFSISSVLLLLLSAGLAATGLHELLEGFEHAGYISENYLPKAWDIFPPTVIDSETTYHLLHHKGSLGSLLHAFTGYSSSPTWWEVLLWLLVFAGGTLLWQRQLKVNQGK
jgi:high-affinity iron transporter